MNKESLTGRLRAATEGRKYVGGLSRYSLKSIEEGRSSYPISNLIAYCEGYGLGLEMTDMATEDRFYPKTVFDVHDTLRLLMERYDIDFQTIHRKTGTHYTPYYKKEGGKANLSVNTLLAVCEVIHCDISFIQVMKSSDETN